VARMTLRNTATDIFMKSANVVHRAVLSASGGRVGRSPFGMPAVELHTIGRKTGQRRSNLLTAPLHDENRVVLIASKGGDDRNPDWYLNLVANPDVEVTIAGETRPMRARTASPDEKTQLWPEVIRVYKGYDSYRRRTERDIPVIICEPRR
jgi:deazaflavin-dependent oxidoreductase (nitroreductase family)